MPVKRGIAGLVPYLWENPGKLCQQGYVWETSGEDYILKPAYLHFLVYCCHWESGRNSNLFSLKDGIMC